MNLQLILTEHNPISVCYSVVIEKNNSIETHLFVVRKGLPDTESGRDRMLNFIREITLQFEEDFIDVSHKDLHQETKIS